MKRVYTVHPFATKELPALGTTDKVIYDNFYLFKVYTDNAYLLKLYMNFIDANFDNAFNRMGFVILTYEYPDDIMYSSGQMVEYINSKYHLEDCSGASLDVPHELAVGYEKNDLVGYTTFMSNCYMGDELLVCGVGIFDDVDALEDLFVASKYVLDKETSILIQAIATKIPNYTKAAMAYGNGCFEMYDPKIIHELYFSFYQLKSFVKNTARGQAREVNAYENLHV